MFTKLGIAALAIAGIVATGSANAARQDFVLNNESGMAIFEAHLSPAYSSHIGPDVLGSNILNDDDYTHIEFDWDTRSCVWDLTVIFEDGGRSVGRHNLCQIVAITVH